MLLVAAAAAAAGALSNTQRPLQPTNPRGRASAEELETDDGYHMPTGYEGEAGREKKYEVLTQRYR